MNITLRLLNGRHMAMMFILAISVLMSCTTTKDYVMLNDIIQGKDSILGPIRPFTEALIAPDDQLSIQVSAYNPDDVQMFNSLLSAAGGGAAISGGSQGGNSAQIPSTLGYMVDKRGMITLPYVGEFLAAGLTLREMELFLGKQLERFVKAPIVKVRFLNHYVNVLGDVGAASQVSMNNERITLFDVLARTGDLKSTAIRSNILVIREEQGHRSTGRIDLRSKTALENPYFYMKNRDVVYVEPVRASYVNRDDIYTRFLGIFTTVISFTLSIFALIR
jgi:polysaccharide export outer membrane protein